MGRCGGWALGLVGAVACTAVMAGCATSGNGVGGPVSTGSTAHAGSAAHRVSTARQRAEADVRAILAAFVPPPGARRLSRPPAAPGGVLNQPTTFLGDATQADGTTFWEAPGGPQALLSWETAHISRRFKPGDADFGPPAWDQAFDLPPVPGVLTSREMIVKVAGLGNGKSGIRVDAEVGWQPARPASDKMPAARAVTIAEIPGMLHPKRPPRPVTVTSALAVGKLAALVNGLAISPFNGASVPCPAPAIAGLTLTFRATPGGKPLATVQTDQPCGVTVFSARPGQHLELTQPVNLNKQILAIAGLHWELT